MKLSLIWSDYEKNSNVKNSQIEKYRILDRDNITILKCVWYVIHGEIFIAYSLDYASDNIRFVLCTTMLQNTQTVLISRKRLHRPHRPHFPSSLEPKNVSETL